LGIIDSLYKSWIVKKYAANSKNLEICLYVNVFNSEKVVKRQIGLIANQSYNHFMAFVEDDASNDSTPMFVKYSIEEEIKEQKHNITFLLSKEKKGLLLGFN
jgi:hypothetical protein